MSRPRLLPLIPIEKDILDLHREIIVMRKEVQRHRDSIRKLKDGIREREMLKAQLSATMNDPAYNPLTDAKSDQCE
jgi:hypothetical protein